MNISWASSLSGKTSYCKIPWSLEAAQIESYNDRIALKFDRHLGSAVSEVSEIWQAPRQRCCRVACQIFDKLEKSNPKLPASKLREILW